MKVQTRFVLFMLLVFVSSCKSKEDKIIIQEKTAAQKTLKEESTLSPLFGEGFGISRTTFIVNDLDSTRKYFTDVLGFKLPEKSEKGIYEGTLTYSLNFPDWSSIELLTIKDSVLVNIKNPLISALSKHNTGLGMYSLYTSSVDSTNKWLLAKGFGTDSARSGRIRTEMPKGWDWDNGGPEWRSLQFSHNQSGYLPEFIEMIGLPYHEIASQWKPYSWRKYSEPNPNGVIGMNFLRMVVSDTRATADEFKKMGLTELKSNDSMAQFRIANNHDLYLIKPAVSDAALNEFLKKRGTGVYAISFQVKNFQETYNWYKKTLSSNAFMADTVMKQLTILKDYACGVQLEFTEESKEQAALAKIYSFKEGTKLDTASSDYAAVVYKKYCALCHGKNREGYAADFAPSLRSHSLMAATQLPRSSYNFLHHTIKYGRSGTAMAPYAKSQGGPLDDDEIDLLLQWLHEKSGVKKPIEMSVKPVKGNIAQGKILYAKHCATCHGLKGEGVRAPALANPLFLATASDAFIRYTISGGRDSTQMPSFKDSLKSNEIDALTAYIRSRASGWNAPEAIEFNSTETGNYILNPNSKGPVFTLREDLYVSAVQLSKAINDSAKMIILDARSEAAWHQTHIPGSISVPYYKEPEKFIKDIPNDNTWIVVYCACPHAASTQVVNTLRRLGYKNTAILDEGILVWAQRGYPVTNGKGTKTKK